MVLACPLRPGCAYSFQYPAHNFRGVLSNLERRRLLVLSVRDTAREPLETATHNLQPLLNRGRYLVTGQDLDKKAERTFYAESMLGLRTLAKSDLPCVRFAVIDQSELLAIVDDPSSARAFARGRGDGTLVISIDRDEQVSPKVSPPPASRPRRQKSTRENVQRTCLRVRPCLRW